MLDFVILLLAISVFSSQVWSTAVHFEMSEMQSGAKIVIAMVIIGLITLCSIVARFEQPPLAQYAGAAMLLGSLAVFWWAIRETRSAKLRAVFTTKNPHTLVQTGPYAYVRHPFYSSYVLFWLGLALGSWSIIGGAFFILLFIIYWRAAADEEQKFLTTDMADAYRAFADKRARLVPPFL
ncbi:MAG: isoprenylcysteine carboxylmethyltransferase family protein [Pseudomonadota bacterium]